MRIQGTRAFGRAQNKQWLAVCPPPHSMLCPPCLSPGPLPVCCRSPHIPLRLVTLHAAATSSAAAMEGAPRTAAGSQRDPSYGCQQLSCVKMPYVDTILGRQGHPYVQEHECTEMVVSSLLVIFKKGRTPQCPTAGSEVSRERRIYIEEGRRARTRPWPPVRTTSLAR